MSRFIASLFMLAALFQYNKLSADDGVQFGIRAGLSTPSDKLGNVYNSTNTRVKDQDGLATLVNEGMSAGYFLGMRIKVGMSDYVNFYGGLSWNKFPEGEITVQHEDLDLDVKLIQSTNVIPINAGVQLYLFKSLIGVYGLGELSYNYINSSIDFPTGDIALHLSKTPSYSRIGFGLGAGVDLNLKLITLNLEAKYSYANLLPTDEDEEKKSFLQVGVGVYFN